MQDSQLRHRTISRRSVLGAMAAGSATVVAGCSFSGTTAPSNRPQAASGAPSGAAAPAVSRASGATPHSDTLQVTLFTDVPSLDPQIVTGGNFVNMIGLFEGLVTVDASGKGVVPAIADRWSVSTDHLTYTFHIRDNATFSNGERITAAAKKFAADATAAAAILDDDKRTTAYIAAAMQRQEMAYQIPLLSGGQNYLVSPTVGGFHANYEPWGFYLKGLTMGS